MIIKFTNLSSVRLATSIIVLYRAGPINGVWVIR